ncbi:MAG: four helix bundle protein [Patescibacteria group bacterium]
MNNSNVKIQKFTDLHAWQEGHKLVLMIYKSTELFPEKERYGLVSQMRRAAVSLTSNIAEGFSRRSSKEKQRFYDMGQGSLVELQNQLIISKDVGYLPMIDFRNIAEQSITANKLVNGLLKATKVRRFNS